MEQVGTITQLLISWSNGDKAAADQLIPIVYDELRRMAASYLKGEASNNSLQTTALVHEAYLRMVDHHTVSLTSRAQFFALASKLMRNILVDQARQRRAAKRGGQMQWLSLSKARGISNEQDMDLVAVDEALNELAATRPRHSQVVELRFFGGLTIEETANVLAISSATVEREWRFARAWLRYRLSGR